MNSEQHAMDGTIRVLKRDGSVEDFNFSKLLTCIRHGFQGSGEPLDRHKATSKGLTEAVQTYLERSEPHSPVPTHYLAELVELVLTQTGYTAASLVIKEHADLRGRRRNWVKVAQRRERDGRIVQKRWSKSRVVRHLVEIHRLETPSARMIAGRVEQLVFNCGIKVVTTGLVDEMVLSELLAWGLLPAALVVKRKRGSQPRLPTQDEKPVRSRKRKVSDKTDTA